MTEIVQLGELDNPNTSRLHCGVLAAQIRQFVGEVLTGDSAQCGGFSDALWPFENQAAVGLRTWSVDPRHGGDEPTGADRTRVFRVLYAEVGRWPSIDSLDSVPMQALQV